MNIRVLIAPEEYHAINSISNDMKKVAKLIDVISGRNQKAIFIKFCDVLNDKVKMQDLSKSLMKLLI